MSKAGTARATINSPVPAGPSQGWYEKAKYTDQEENGGGGGEHYENLLCLVASLRCLWVLTHLILSSQAGRYYYPHCTDEKTRNNQRGYYLPKPQGRTASKQ